MEELVTYADLSRRHGVSVNTLRQWRLRGKIPEPDYRVSGSPAWKESTLASWTPPRDSRFTKNGDTFDHGTTG